ncbi:P-loop containing nucleoside triphosphate hydrolase protein [Cladochytrium replicatum]|nr:P-loop containing nucleoside triphosphate hydrolase protein [Cladochytrium replicatum]
MYSLADLQNLSEVTSTQQRFSTDNRRGASSKEISLRGISLAFGSLTILNNAQIKLAYGTKYALIGRNGIGKTTLLRCMANNLIPQWTSIRTFLVQQEYEAVDASPLDLVKQSDPDHQALLKGIERAEQNDESVETITELYDQLGVYDESEMERRAADILAGLKFTKEMMARPFKSLSGGWRMKALLACAVFANPHLLLMDEPTNHLDLKSIQWLVDYLKDLECTVIVVSHDHDFLDRYTQCIIHLTQKQLRYYPGNYSEFKAHRNDKILEQENTEKKRQKARESGTVRKELEGPKIAKMSKKTLANTGWVWGGEALLVGAEGEDDKKINLRFPDPDFSVADVLMQLKGVGFSFGDRLLWDKVDLTLGRTSRIAIMGRNGLGKSTLLRCIAGVEKPTKGQIVRHHNLRMAFFTQHLVQDIDLTKSPVELLMEMYPELKVQDTRDYLGSFGISGDRALERLRVLSGGQRTRFVFAMLMFLHPHLLLLDEPTSHLDMEMTEALISALQNFKGAVVLISHHSYFLRQLDCQYYAVANKKLTPIDSLDAYLQSNH